MAKKAKVVEEVRLLPPDWRCHSFSTGANHDGLIPRPWVWRWPNEEGVRRDVLVDVSTWRGMSVGASHFYATVEEEPNRVWDGRRGTWWTNDRADDGMKVRKFRADVFTREQAVRFVEAVLGLYFSDEKVYRVVAKYGQGGVGRASVMKALAREGGGG